MAIRMHVVGAAGGRVDDLGRAFEALGAGEVGEGDGIARMRLSSRRATARGVDDALRALERPTLRATTVDGSYWVLSLSRPGADPFTAEHPASRAACRRPPA